MAKGSTSASDTPPVWGALALAGSYIGLGVAFRSAPLAAISGGLVWPPVGAALAALLLFGLRLWPGLVVAALLEPWLAGASATSTLGSAAGVVVETLGTAAILRKLGLRASLDRVRDVVLFICVAVIGGALAGSVVSSAARVLAGALPGSRFLEHCLECYRGDALGLLLVTPLALTWSVRSRLEWLRRRPVEATAYWSGLLAVSMLAATGLPFVARSGFPVRYLVFPFLFWGALRFGPPLVAAANVLVVAVSAHGGWLEAGLLPGETVANRVTLLWAYSLFGSATGLMLAANTRERQAARRQAEAIHHANRALTRSLELESVLDTLLTELAKLVPHDRSSVVLSQEGRLVRRAARGGEGSSAARIQEPSVSAEPEWWRELERGSLVVSDSLQDPRRTPLGVEHARSWLAVPLRPGGSLVGYYALGKTEAGFFTAEHVRLAEAVAAQGAVAVENARLYEHSRRTEQALRASEARFATVFAASPDPISIHRLSDGRCIEANQSFLAFVGASRADVVGRTPAELGLGGEPQQVERLSELLRTQAACRNVEVGIRSRSGDERTILVSAGPLEIDGEACLLVVARDISERKRMEAALRDSEDQLRQAQKMEAIGRLAGGVAHDFNNMLMAIGAWCDLLDLGSGGSDRVRTAVVEIRAIVERAASLSRRLLTFSRKHPHRPRVVRPNALCERSLGMLRRLIPSNVEIRFEPQPDAWNVRIDPTSLEQVLLNLCVNARDAMPSGGVLAISTTNAELDGPLRAGPDTLSAGRYLRLRVSDTGTGMDAATKARLFEPFFTTKSEGQGSGLGLSVVYGVVRQSGGAVSVESAPGRGTTFAVYLPRTDDPVDAAEEATLGAAAPTGSESILLVEDQDSLRAALAQYLEAAGYQVLAARNGNEALDLARRSARPVDLLLSDVVMPGQSGPALLDALSALRPGLPVLYMSGYSRDLLTTDGPLPDRIGFLQKPVPLQDLLLEIRRLLDASAG